MDRLQTLEAFVAVADAGSFAAAAQQLRVAKSVVTARVQQLEEYVGAPLLHRTTRSVKLTELGQAYVKDCAELLSRSTGLLDDMRKTQNSPEGKLRIHALPGFVLGHLAVELQEFQQLHPDINLDLFVSDTVIDPVKEGFDCTLQIFSPASEELVAQKMFPVRRVFCASPAYLSEHGTPDNPRDLREHRLGLYSGYQTRDRWDFFRDQEVISIHLKPPLLTNSVHLLAEYGCANAGVVCIPTLVASPFLVSGELVPLLTDWQLSSFWLSAIYPHTSRRGLKLQLFINHLMKKFAGTPPWDQVLIEKGWLTKEPAQLV
ncbi:MAG: LysR family transcriptional regulator [Oxalobacteraceae bacterium]|nr:LysR family transcriptional regulator [Oxalobacteraceae bacterium]